jgi:serine/threonine protein kinase
VVFRARDKSNGRVLALKRIKLEAFRYGFPQTSIREINILLSLHHRNIVNVLEVRGARGGCDRLVLQGDVRVVPAVERTWSPLLLGLHLTCPLCLPPLALSHALPLLPVPIPFTLSSSNQTPPVLSSCLLLTCPLPPLSPAPRPAPLLLPPRCSPQVVVGPGSSSKPQQVFMVMEFVDHDVKELLAWMREKGHAFSQAQVGGGAQQEAGGGGGGCGQHGGRDGGHLRFTLATPLFLSAPGTLDHL